MKGDNGDTETDTESLHDNPALRYIGTASVTEGHRARVSTPKAVAERMSMAPGDTATFFMLDATTLVVSLDPDDDVPALTDGE